jgi:hypothetical protein
MAIPHHQKDNKEIRLFGEKSIREEAYRKKILQLEKELSNLEILAKVQEEADSSTPAGKPENLNNLYYESLMSFDARIKKEQDFLEKRATEITERLDVHAQKALIAMERLYRKQTRFLLFAVLCSALFFIGLFLYLNFSGLGYYSYKSDFNGMEARIPYIKNAISEGTKYRHNYLINSIAIVNDKFIVEIFLNSIPNEAWYLRDVTQDVAKVFNRSSGSAQGEIIFSYNGKIYAKAHLSGPLSRPYIRYFN